MAREKSLVGFRTIVRSAHPWDDVFHDATFSRFARRYEDQHPEWRTLNDADDWAWENARGIYYDFLNAIADGEINPAPSYRLFWKGEREEREKQLDKIRRKIIPRIIKNTTFWKGFKK